MALTAAQGAVLKVFSIAAIASFALLGLYSVATLASTWNSVRIRPTRLHLDASETLPRALLAVDADVDGLDRTAHGLSLRGGRCELFGGRGGMQRLLLARSRDFEHKGGKARLVAELEHGSLRQATEILKEGPARDLLCSFDVEVDIFKTGLKFSRTFRAPDFLKGKEDFGFRYKVVRDPTKWNYPRNGTDMHVTADMRHWIEVNMVSHTPEKLAQFFQNTAVHLKAGLTYADEGHGAVHLRGGVDSPVKYKVEGTGRDTKVSLAIPVDFQATGHVKKLALSVAKNIVGGSSLKAETNGGFSYSSNFRAQQSRSPLAVAFGPVQVLKLRTDGPVDGQELAQALKSVHGSLLSTLRSMHPKGAQRRLSDSKLHATQSSMKDGAFKIRAVLSFSDDDVQAFVAEIKEGETASITCQFVLRRYEREGQIGKTGSTDEEKKTHLMYTNVKAGVTVETATPVITASMNFGGIEAGQEQSYSQKGGHKQNDDGEWEHKPAGTKMEYKKEDQGLSASVSYDAQSMALSASIELKMGGSEEEYNDMKDYRSSSWYKTNQVENIKDPYPAGGLRRLQPNPNPRGGEAARRRRATGSSNEPKPKTSSNKVNAKLTASIDFDGIPFTEKIMLASLSVDLGDSMPMKMSVDYYMTEPTKDKLEHYFTVTSDMPVRKLRRQLYKSSDSDSIVGETNYFAVTSMNMSGTIYTDISGKTIPITGTITADKLACNLKFDKTETWGTSEGVERWNAWYNNIMDADNALCPIVSRKSGVLSSSSKASCCSKFDSEYMDNEGFLDLVQEMPMTMTKGWSDSIKADVSNFLKSADGSDFDIENMKMSAGDAKTSPVMIETKTKDGTNHVDIKIMDGSKTAMGISATLSDNAKNGKKMSAALILDSKAKMNMDGEVGNKDDVLSYSASLNEIDGGVSKHMFSYQGEISRKEAVVGKYGIKHSDKMYTGKEKELAFDIENFIQDKSTSTKEHFTLSMLLRQKTGGPQEGVTGTAMRAMSGDDDTYSLEMMGSGIDDLPYVNAVASKKNSGTSFEMTLTVNEKSSTGKQIFKYTGAASKAVSSGTNTYTMQWSVLDSDNKKLVQHTGDFKNQPTQGVMTMSLAISGDEMLTATSTMPKTKNSLGQNRLKGPIKVTSKSEDLEIPTDFSLIAEASDGFLPIADKFNEAGFTKFDVALTVTIEKVDVKTSFYCEQPPDRMPKALPWTGVGMRVEFDETKDSGAKHKVADVNWDADLPIETTTTKKIVSSIRSRPGLAPEPEEPKEEVVTTQKVTLTVDDPTKFDKDAFLKEAAKSMDLDTAKGESMEVEVESFDVEVGFDFEGETAITEAEAKTAIAATMNVAEDKVIVKITSGRRLMDASRRWLSTAVTKVTATIKTDSPTKAAAVKTTASDDTAVTAKVSKNLEKAGKTVTAKVAQKPVVKVKVVTKTKSTEKKVISDQQVAKAAKAADPKGVTGMMVEKATSVVKNLPKLPRVQTGSANGSLRSCLASFPLLMVALSGARWVHA